MLCNNCGNVLESFQKFCSKCGAPAPAPYQPPTYGAGSAPYSSPQPPMMGGQSGPPPRKSSCGKVLLIVGVLLVLLVLGVAAAIYFGYHKLRDTLKSSEAYTTAVNRLKENEEVRNELGEIKDTGFPLGSFRQDADGSGFAAFTMSVQGTKANGRYEVRLLREKRVWRVASGEVTTDSGKTIDVTDNAKNTGEQANTNNNSNTDVTTPQNGAKMISRGILNSKATSLPQPAYPPIAKQAHASGAVVVQVVVDEEGNVISATAVSGHPLLRSAAAAAARGAKFPPTKLSGKPVKVSGVITYNFAAE
jgi:TonB family protein